MTEQEKINISNLNVPMWANILLTNGVDPVVIPIIISQIIFESGWFKSAAYKLDHNPGGITWNNNYLHRPGASVGRQRAEGGHYVHFNNYNDAALDYIRILNKAGSLGKPIDATTPLEYAKRLKANSYFTSPLIDYTNGINSINNKLKTWFDYAVLLKKKSSLNMAAINPIIIGLAIGLLFFKK